MPGGTSPDLPTAAAAAPLSISVLQSRIRRVFADRPANFAVCESLAEIGAYLDAEYLVLHAGFGMQMFSEEWHDELFTVPDQLREKVNHCLVEAMGEERARCARMGKDPALAPAVVAAPIFDQGHEVVGGAAVVLGPCGRERAKEILISFEGVLGLLSALVGGVQAGPGHREEAAGLLIPEDARVASGSPLYLAYAMVARLKNRHELEQAALGFVRGRRVAVVAISGLAEVRASNPGVQQIAAAMEETLDRGQPSSCLGFGLEDDCGASETAHLHEAWSRALGGDAVASFPLREGGRITAVMALRCPAGRVLDDAQLQQLAEEMEPYASLLPITRAAERGLRQHCADSCQQQLQRLLGARAVSKLAWALLLCCLLWVVFGSLEYRFTVPCEVIPAQPRQVSSPREGVLAEVLVKPGDRVREGQLLARLDDVDDRLQIAALQADLLRLEALMDTARAEARPGDLRVHQVERAAVQAQLALLQERILAAEIRAPLAGLVMTGDLRQSLGARLAIGTPLLQIAENHAVQVELRIPEAQVWDAQAAAAASFAPRGRPQDRIRLDGLQILPQGEPEGGKNVFRARSSGFEPPQGLLPGMEGFVRVDAGARPVWWILSHRITDWLRLRFWL